MQCFPQAENLLVVVGGAACDGVVCDGAACDGAACDGHCFVSTISILMHIIIIFLIIQLFLQ